MPKPGRLRRELTCVASIMEVRAKGDPISITVVVDRSAEDEAATNRINFPGAKGVSLDRYRVGSSVARTGDAGAPVLSSVFQREVLACNQALVPAARTGRWQKFTFFRICR